MKAQMHQKKVQASETTITQFVLPNDTNTLNNLRGGQLLHWMDLAAAISAQKHANSIVVTVAVDHVSFDKPIRLGDVVTIKASLTRAFKSSMEIFMEVWADNIPGNTHEKSNEAYFTFVAIDERGKPIPVPVVVPESEEEHKRYNDALTRREIRLVLAGRLKPENAAGIQKWLQSK